MPDPASDVTRAISAHPLTLETNATHDPTDHSHDDDRGAARGSRDARCPHARIIYGPVTLDAHPFDDVVEPRYYAGY